MNPAVRVLRNLFRVRHEYADPFNQQQARGLSWIAWGAIIVALLYVPFLLFSGYPAPYVGSFLASVAVMIIGMAVVLILVNQGSVFGASLVYIALLYLAVIATTFRYVTNPGGANVFSLSVPIVAAGVLLNRRGMAVMVVLVALVMIGLQTINLLDLLPSFRPILPAPFENFWLNVIYLLVDGIMLGVFAGGQRSLLHRILSLTDMVRNSSNMSVVLAKATSVDSLLTQAAEQIRDQFGYYHVQIFISEEASGLLVLRAATSISYSRADSGRRRITPDDPSVLNEVIHSGRLIRVVVDDPDARRTEFLSATQCELLIPMMRDNHVLGVLDVQSIEAEFAPSEIQILQTMAVQLALAIQNAQLIEVLQEASQQHDQLAVQLREATREVEYLNREASGYGWTRYLRNRAENALGFDWREGVLTPNSAISEAFEHAMHNTMPEIRSQDGAQILSVPIVLRGQVLGAMEFQAALDSAWNNRSLELARVIAQRLALAMDNIRLYEQAQTIANRERVANQVSARLQTKTDIDSLVAVAAESFQQALGATRTNIRFGTPDQSPSKDQQGQR